MSEIEVGEYMRNKELIKLIQENPELPVVFLAQNDDFVDGCGSTFFENFCCKVDTVYLFDNEYSDDLIYVKEIFGDRLCDIYEYKDLSDEDFEKAINKYIEDNIEHYKAIVVSLYH